VSSIGLEPIPGSLLFQPEIPRQVFGGASVLRFGKQTVSGFAGRKIGRGRLLARIDLLRNGTALNGTGE
jgi:hypothetical protein